MKNIYGLLLALGLGVAGGVFNWAYLRSESQNMVMTSFIGLAKDVERGHRLGESDLVAISIPKDSVGNLDEYGIRWSARQSVIDGEPITRFRKAGSLLVREDMGTPPPEIKLGTNERVLWIPVDARTFVLSMVVPGDQVSFLVPSTPSGVKSIVDAGDPVASPPQPAAAPEGPATLGPFTVLSLGNRLSSPEALKAAKVPQLQENVVGIKVRVDENEKLQDPLAAKLVSVLYSTNYRPLGVMWGSQRAKRR
jgi:hypothetical protein